jgi:HAD superfamily hydrolase (TIGR01509 family)
MPEPPGSGAWSQPQSCATFGGRAAAIVTPMSPDADEPSEWPSAVLFDLDGTLVDTVQARIDAWAEALAERGIEVRDGQLGPMIGMDGRRLAREIAAAEGAELTADDAEALDSRSGELFDERNRDPRPLPGARELLARLDERGVTWAIATSSRRAQVLRSVRALECPREPRVIDGSNVRNAKPAPDLLLHAARELAAPPGTTWYVGDSTWDMQAARAAGMHAIGVLAGAAVDADALREAGAHRVVATLADLDVAD